MEVVPDLGVTEVAPAESEEAAQVDSEELEDSEAELEDSKPDEAENPDTRQTLSQTAYLYSKCLASEANEVFALFSM